VSFTLGLYEVFAYSLPGGAYAALLAYLADRFGWLPHPLPFQGEAGVAVLVLAGLSYALGHLAYGAGRWLEREVRPWLTPPRRRGAGTRVERNRARFLTRCPQAAGRPYLAINPSLLLAAVQLQNRDAAAEVERINVGAMMLRGLAPPAFAGAAVAVVEAVVRGRPDITGLAALLAATGTACWLLYDQRARWAEHKVYEFAFWMPEIDAALVKAAPPPP
jgi:hypothetical protein